MNRLLHLYKQRLDIQKATFSRIDHEDAMVAIVYKVTQPTGVSLILKIGARTCDYLREAYFLKHFADVVPVPRIIDLVPPEPGIPGAILMEYLPGTLLKASDFTQEIAHEIGSLLARIHLNRVVGYGDLTQPDELCPDARNYFTLKFEEGVEECRNHLPTELIEQCCQYYDTNVNLLTCVDGPCMIHRDFRPGNMIICEGKLQGIIDWASGRASFTEEDFCPLEHGGWPTHPSLKKSFLEGYARIRPVPDYNTLMPLLRLSKALATIGFTVKSGTWEGKNARIYKFNHHFLEEFFRNEKKPLKNSL